MRQVIISNKTIVTFPSSHAIYMQCNLQNLFNLNLWTWFCLSAPSPICGYFVCAKCYLQLFIILGTPSSQVSHRIMPLRYITHSPEPILWDKRFLRPSEGLGAVHCHALSVLDWCRPDCKFIKSWNDLMYAVPRNLTLLVRVIQCCKFHHLATCLMCSKIKSHNITTNVCYQHLVTSLKWCKTEDVEVIMIHGTHAVSVGWSDDDVLGPDLLIVDHEIGDALQVRGDTFIKK